MPALAEPVVETVTLFPENPWIQSEIVFNVTITSDTTIDEAHLIVRECKEGICYMDSFNETLTLIGTDSYQATLTLKHDDTTYIEYEIETKSNNTWFNSDVTTLNLSEEPTNGEPNGDGTSNGDNDGKTPGFELPVLILSLALFILVYRRKRYE